MKKVKCRGRVDEKGRLLMAPDQKRAYELAIAAHAEHEISITVARWRNQRSLAQNARYFALLSVGAESLWGDRSQTEQLHEDVAQVLLALPPDPKTGAPRRDRTPDLDTVEFNDYMDRVAEKLIEFGADLSKWDEEAERLAAA